MQIKNIAIVAAVASSFLFGSAARAELLELHLFPGVHDRDADVIHAPAVLPGTGMINTLPAVFPSLGTTVHPAVVPSVGCSSTITHSAVVEPLAEHNMIRAVPENVAIRTLPAVIDSGFSHSAVVPGCASTTNIIAPSAASLIEPLSLDETVLGLNHADRLADMMDQVNLGSTKGWLTSEEVSALNAEKDRIASMINQSAPGALTTAEIDQVEKALTGFNQRISAELNDSEGAVAGTEIVPL